MNLPVFYRESLARLLALEKHRNLIETNITAGITLYTDHKPGLYENSLSNKGQLSAWRLLETADLLSIVENLYRTGGKMLLAGPLSRLCAPSDGFYDMSLPAKVNVLLENLPLQVAECKMMKVFANKDTAAVARMVQKWRKPTNPISQGKLGSFAEPKQSNEADEEQPTLLLDSSVVGLKAFSIGTPHADTGVREIRELIASGKYFAVLISISLIPQIARGVNASDMDEEIALKVDQMTKLVMAATADAWLINLPVHHVFYPLYYWPGMDATIEAVCTACAKCIRATRRRRKLNLDFNPSSQKELLLPRQRYGIDFYGVHNGEILVMVDLFSRETMLEFLPDRKI